MGQRGLWGLESPCVVGQLWSHDWMTAVPGEIRQSRTADSSSYGGGIGGRYIKGGLSGSLGRKGPCARM